MTMASAALSILFPHRIFKGGSREVGMLASEGVAMSFVEWPPADPIDQPGPHLRGKSSPSGKQGSAI